MFYKRRILIMLFVLAAPMIVIVGRLFSMQVVNKTYFVEQLQSKSNYLQVFKPARGTIYDRNGMVLAKEQREFEIHVLLYELKSDEAIASTMDRLAYALGTDAEDLKTRVFGRLNHIIEKYKDLPERERKRLTDKDRNTPFRVYTHVQYESIVQIETEPEDFPGVLVIDATRRVYPYGSAASHIIGYVGSIQPGEYERLLEENYFRSHFTSEVQDEEFDYIQRIWGFRDEMFGRGGIERYYDEYLKGKRGVVHVEKEIYHKTKKVIKEMPAEHGYDLYLTIDIELQKKVEAALSGRKGAAVVMDAATGEVLAMASMPNFDPNKLISPVAPEYAQYVNINADTPMLNRAIEGAYPLGSIFKVITSFAALEDEKITASTEFTCNGYLFPEKKRFACWISARGEGLGHGALNVVGGLMHSCNVFFYQTGGKAGIDSIYKWGNILGLGRQTGIDLYGEVPGIMPSRDWKREFASKNKGVDPVWRDADTWNLSIGQGFIAVTPIQVVSAMCVIANGGHIVRPHILFGGESVLPYKIPLKNPQTVELINKGLYSVVNEHGGTAYATDLREVDCSAKTSTAQVVSSDELGALPEYRPHAWIAGFHPTKDPKIAFVVFVEHGGSGGQAAAPIAAAIVRGYMELNKKK